MDGISKHYGVSYTPVRQALGGDFINKLLFKTLEVLATLFCRQK